VRLVVSVQNGLKTEGSRAWAGRRLAPPPATQYALPRPL